MLKNQKGFGHLGIILIIVVIALVAFSGWFVWSKNKTDDKSNTGANRNDSSESAAVNDKETYVIPEGHTLYKNVEVGFKLTYPEAWQAPKVAANAGTALAAVLSDDALAAEGDVKGAPQIFFAPTAQFEANIEYKGATLRPVTSDGVTVWEVKDAGLADVTVGSTYTPAPKVLFEEGNIKVYEFPASHANSAWATLVFRINDTYVGITSPVFNPSSDLDQEEFDVRRANFNASLLQVAKSIREI